MGGLEKAERAWPRNYRSRRLAKDNEKADSDEIGKRRLVEAGCGFNVMRRDRFLLAGARKADAWAMRDCAHEALSKGGLIERYLEIEKIFLGAKRPKRGPA
jgi:hypothetical protein